MDVTKIRSDKVQEAQVKDLQKSQNGTSAQSIKDGLTVGTEGLKQSHGTEKVKWSENASLFAEGVNAAKAAPNVRSEKVAALKAAIKNGSYQVDAEAVADKMLKASLEEQKA